MPSQVFEGSDACVTPVLTMDEAPHHPMHKERDSFALNASGGGSSACAPRYTPRPSPVLSASPAPRHSNERSYPVFGQHTSEILREHGYNSEDIQQLQESGVVEQCDVAVPSLKGKL